MITEELLFYFYTPHTAFCKKTETDVLFTFTFYITLPYLTYIKHNACYPKTCLVMSRSKGKGKGIRAPDHARGRRKIKMPDKDIKVVIDLF